VLVTGLAEGNTCKRSGRQDSPAHSDLEGIMARRLLGNAWPVLVLAIAGCATNPATGEREFSLVSEAQEIQIGRDADPAITAEMGGLYGDSAVQRYVRELGLRLAATSERPNLPWSFKVLDDDLINAFALPGGFIYVTRGILSNMTSEAELAGVLGHEIGHVTARHTAGAITRAQLAQLGLGIGMIFSETIREYGQAASVGLQLLFLKYGRDDERQADELGFRYMTRQQYDPHGISEVMRMLAQSASGGEAGGIPNWLSSHPDPGDRVQANERRITESGVDYSSYQVNRDGFLQRLNGLVFGADPRQGYFISQRFLHPTLRFELTFPAGWAKQNTAQSVQGMSSGQDAALQLSFATESTAAAAANALRQMQGLTVVRSTRSTVNGLTAEQVEFDLTTQQGALHGLAWYVEYGGAVYELVGYTPQQRWTSYQSPVQTALGTFRPLTDQRYLDVSPHRVTLVRLPRTLTFAEFMQQYPSSVPAEQVALANHVSQNESLASGRQMKRITGGRVPTS
jgi:predicted Zn-dependent protease